MTEEGGSVSEREPDSDLDVRDRARTLLDKALRALRIRSIADELQNRPIHGAREIRDSVLAQLERTVPGPGSPGSEGADPEEAALLLCLAMDLLELQLEEAVPEGAGRQPRVLHVATPSGPPPLPDRLDRLLDQTHGLDSKLVDQSWVSASKSEQVGLLVGLLVTRGGLCNKALIRAVLGALWSDVPICVSAKYIWVVISLELDGIAQKRRVFLDPATVAAMALVRNSLKDKRAPTDRRALDSKLASMIKDGWAALCARLAPNHALPKRLSRLMDSVAARIQLHSVPLLAGYARGLVHSTSWQESCWLQMVGYGNAEPVAALAVAPDREGRGADETSELPLIDRAISEPVDEDPFLASLREATTAHRKRRSAKVEKPEDQEQETAAKTARQTAEIKLKELIAQVERGSTKHYIASWVLHMLKHSRHGAKRRLRLSTINHFRSTLASRLLGFLPERLDGLAGEELTDLLAELVDSVQSPHLRRRVSELLRRFNAFCLKEGMSIEGSYELPQVSAAEADISARHVSERDYRRALESLRTEGDDLASLQTRVFLILAYRYGARRAEILGLTLLDIEGGNAAGEIRIRPNDARALKTSNARRRLPLALLEKRERADLRMLRDHRLEQARARAIADGHDGAVTQVAPSNRELLPKTYLFLDDGQAPADQIPSHPAARAALQALRIATGDWDLHLHHLRHAFATRHLVGALVSDLPKGSSESLPAAFFEMRDAAMSFHKHVYARVGRLARRGSMVSMAMGHGSDETTYRHYVHGLDLLVYATMRAWRRNPPGRPLEDADADLETPRQNAAEAAEAAAATEIAAGSTLTTPYERGPTLGIRQVEATEAAVILGRSPLTRPPSDKIPTWIANKAREHGLKVINFRTEDSRTRPTLDVHWAKDQFDQAKGQSDQAKGQSDQAKGQPDKARYPETSAQHEHASATLRLLAESLARSPRRVAPVVKMLANGLRSDGWSELPCAEAATLLQEPEDFAPLRFDFRRRAYENRVRVMVALTGEALAEWLGTEGRLVQIRISDPKAGQGPKIHRHQQVTAWVLKAAVAYIETFMPDALEKTAPAAPGGSPSGVEPSEGNSADKTHVGEVVGQGALSGGRS